MARIYDKKGKPKENKKITPKSNKKVVPPKKTDKSKDGTGGESGAEKTE